MRTLNLFLIAALAITGLVPGRSQAQGRPVSPLKPGQLLPVDPDLRTGKLANGFTYYLRHNAEPQKRVVMYLANKVGSLQEDEDQRGLAHFMEHMSFNGTRQFPKNALVDYLQRSGVRFGADLNAYTSFAETVYQLPIPSDQPELLSNGLRIMRDWAQEATLDPKEIDKERGVVLEEKRLGKGAEERMQRVYWPVLLENSKYATRIPIGVDAVLNNFKKAELLRFYRDWYRPSLQALIVVGDVDIAQLEKQVIAQFSTLKNPVKMRTRQTYTVPVSGKDHFIALSDPELTSTTVQISIRHRARGLRTQADLERVIATQLFNQMLSNRYTELSNQPAPAFLAAAGGIGGFLGDADSYSVNIQTRPGQLEAGLKAVWRESVRLKRFGFSLAELQQAKADYLNRVSSMYKEKDKLPSEIFAKQYQELFLHGTASPGLDYEYRFINSRLPQIGLDTVNALIKEYLKGVNRDILVESVASEKNGLPSAAKFYGWLAEVEQEKLQQHQDDLTGQLLMDSWPLPGKIIAKTSDHDNGLTTMTLSNGIKVILKPTNFKNDEILFDSFAPGGSSVYPDSRFQSATNAAALIAAGGLGNYDINRLGKYLGDKKVAVNPYLSERIQGVSGGTSPKDLELALQLIHATYAAPRLDTAIFRSLLDRTRAALTERNNAPANVFADTVSAVLGNHHSRHTAPSKTKLDQIEVQDAFDIYKESFSRLGGLTFTFVGNIDTAVIAPLLEKYLANIPGDTALTPAVDLGINIPSGRIFREVHKGNEPQATVNLFWAGPYQYGQRENLIIDALKECLQIRLIERLREDESGTYSPKVSASVTRIPGQRYTLAASFGCAPENASKLIASVNEEVAKLIEKGPLQVNVDKWRAETLRQHESAVHTNNWWLTNLNDHELNQNPLISDEIFNSTVAGIKPGDVQKAAASYLSGKNYIQLVLLPEDKGKVK